MNLSLVIACALLGTTIVLGSSERFPWEEECNLGSELLINGKPRETGDTEIFLDDVKTIALYFSSDQCHLCRYFTPILKDLYEHSWKDAGIEVIFIASKIHNQSDFEEYYKTMPWLASPFDKNKHLKSEFFTVEATPSLVFLDAQTGELLTKAGILFALEYYDTLIEEQDNKEWKFDNSRDSTNCSSASGECDNEEIEGDDFYEGLEEDEKEIEFVTEFVKLVEDFYKNLVNVHVQQVEGQIKVMALKQEEEYRKELRGKQAIKKTLKMPPVETKPNIKVSTGMLPLFQDMIPAQVYGTLNEDKLKKALDKKKFKNDVEDKKVSDLPKKNKLAEKARGAIDAAKERATQRKKENKNQTRYSDINKIKDYRKKIGKKKK